MNIEQILKTLREAIGAYPPAKIIWIAIAVSAAAAVIAALGLGFNTLIYSVGYIFLVIIGFGFVAFIHLIFKKQDPHGALAKFLSWSTAILGVSAMVALLGSLFFGYPLVFPGIERGKILVVNKEEIINEESNIQSGEASVISEVSESPSSEEIPVVEISNTSKPESNRTTCVEGVSQSISLEEYERAIRDCLRS